ncbi:MAG: hypothetical protein JOS17DRAFT_728978 [Linnemannia elongata]|nr:MAG: hypothetical protein JOS17DRAFT_728978 [Linnemannia elongata]
MLLPLDNLGGTFFLFCPFFLHSLHSCSHSCSLCAPHGPSLYFFSSPPHLHPTHSSNSPQPNTYTTRGQTLTSSWQPAYYSDVAKHLPHQASSKAPSELVQPGGCAGPGSGARSRWRRRSRLLRLLLRRRTRLLLDSRIPFLLGGWLLSVVLVSCCC